MAGWPFKKRSKKRSPATLGFLIRGPRHHRFWVPDTTVFLILLFAVSAKLILLLLVFMMLQVSDIYIRSILLFSIAGFCSQPQARDAQYKSKKRATTSAAAINKHCSLKRSKGLRHLLLCIFLHPVISAEAKGTYVCISLTGSLPPTSVHLSSSCHIGRGKRYLDPRRPAFAIC